MMTDTPYPYAFLQAGGGIVLDKAGDSAKEFFSAVGGAGNITIAHLQAQVTEIRMDVGFGGCVVEVVHLELLCGADHSLLRLLVLLKNTILYMNTPQRLVQY